MSDIVERLRAAIKVAGPYRSPALLRAASKAADEIERLRAALGFARCVIKSGEPWTDRCEEMIDRALEQKP